MTAETEGRRAVAPKVLTGEVAAEPSPPPALVDCPLCGQRFDPATAPACASCPLGRLKCGFAHCPNCGYEIPVRSQLWDWFTRMTRRWRKS